MIKRHHPIVVIHKIYSQIRYSIIPIALFLFNEIRAGTGQQPYWVYGAAAVYGVLISVWSVLSWYRETYQMDDRVLHLTNGVFTVTQRTIPFSKMNNILVEQNWLYRLIGIAEVELQTSDSNEYADAYLTLSLKNADKLKAILGMEDEKVREAQCEYRMNSKEIVMLSISSNAFWLGLPFTATAVQYLWSWIYSEPEEERIRFVDYFQADFWSNIRMGDITVWILLLLAFFGICIVISWLFSVGAAQVRFRDWHVARTDSMITIQRGLMDRKTVRIHADRIQAIRVKELIFGRFFGYVSVSVDCVGYRGEQRAKMLIPSIRKAELDTILRGLVPEFERITPMRNLHHYAIWSSFLPISLGVSVGVLISCFYSLWFMVGMAVLFPVYRYLKYVYTQSKWDVQGRLFVLCRAGMNQTTVYLLRESTESIKISQSRWQQPFQLYRLEMELDAPENAREYRLTGIAKPDYDEIVQWYKNQKLVRANGS